MEAEACNRSNTSANFSAVRRSWYRNGSQWQNMVTYAYTKLHKITGMEIMTVRLLAKARLETVRDALCPICVDRGRCINIDFESFTILTFVFLSSSIRRALTSNWHYGACSRHTHPFCLGCRHRRSRCHIYYHQSRRSCGSLRIFMDATLFSGGISQWGVSSVTNMNGIRHFFQLKSSI